MLCDELVFSVDAEDYAWRDVVVAAVRWGNWTVVEHRTREGHAATRHAESSGQPLQPAVLPTYQYWLGLCHVLCAGQDFIMT